MESFKCEEIENTYTTSQENGGSSETPASENSFQRKACDYSAVEDVFNIDHILEQILGYLNIADLINCRLVSFRWRLFSKTPLQNLLTIKFDENILGGDLYDDPEQKNKTLSQLLTFLETSQEFPCVKFELSSTSLMDRDVKNFLNFYGPYITELTFGYLSFDENEKDVLICVRNLLGHQTPNLRFLRIEVSSQVSWINNVRINEYSNGFQPNDPELNEIHKNCKDLKNSKLKVAHMVKPWNVKVMETILQLSPNLEEIKFCLDDDMLVGFKEICSLDPKNRVHLIKSLPLHVFNYEECEEILNMGQAVGVNLQFRELMLRFTDDEGGDDLRLANIINKIFENSYNSLKYINWGSLQILSAIKFPEVMPKVQELRFSSYLREGFNVPKSVFTADADICFSTIFPDLRRIYIFTMASWDNVVYFLFRIYHKSMPGVKIVQLESDHYRSKVKSGCKKKILELFPNANVFERKIY